MSSSWNLRVIDARIRMALKGTEKQRGVVIGIAGRVATIKVGNVPVPCIVPAMPVPLVLGSVVEVDRPRGIAGQFQVARVLGVSGPAAVDTAIEAGRGTTSVVQELPVASALYRGRTLLLEADAAVDTFWRCRRKADGTYEWVAA